MKKRRCEYARSRKPRPARTETTGSQPGRNFCMRLMGYVFRDYKIHCISVLVLILLIGVLANVQGTMFTKNLIDDYITPFLLTDQPDFSPLAGAIGRVAIFYGLGVISTYAYNRIMVSVTQGTLRNLRNDLFSHMELLPIRYFDTHAHGDIMSVYTNRYRYAPPNDQPEYSADHQQPVYDRQCLCEHAHSERAADPGDHTRNG